jgi:hypothetical protein
LKAALASILAVAPIAACGPAEPPVRTVKQILAQCDAMLGKPVRAAGFLGECAGYDCHLFADKESYNAWFAFIDAIALEAKQITSEAKSAQAPRRPAEPDGMIGIGGEEAFDRKAAPLQHSYVVITGRVADHSCTGAGGTDRSSGIEPTDIRTWTPSEGAPNTH